MTAQRSSFIGLFLRGVAFVGILLVPLLGVWSATSLASYWNGPREVALVVGLVCFPLGPLAWDFVAQRRRARREQATKKPPAARILTFGDRVLLRTLLINSLFVGVMAARWPVPLFAALSTRGDWFLDGVPGAEPARAWIHAAADRVEWLYQLAWDNPYDTGADEPLPDDLRPHDTRTPTPENTTPENTTPENTAPENTAPESPSPPDAARLDDHDARPAPTETQPPTPAPTPRPVASVWPSEATVHPAAAALLREPPERLEAAIAALRTQTSSELDRARATHDFVASWVRYDVDALRQFREQGFISGDQFPQDAEQVFARRIGVCAGYADLYMRMARGLGLEARTVVGDARDASDPLQFDPHAWNAVRIDGQWYLLDVTWDAGSVGNEGFRASLSTAYFLTPPRVFLPSHFPDAPAYQLLDTPVGRGDFLRMPVLSPTFAAEGFTLISPDRAQSEHAGASIAVSLRSDAGRYVMVSIAPHGQSSRVHCTESPQLNSDALVFDCPMGGPGTFDVLMFSNTRRYGNYHSIGGVQVIRR